MNKMSGSARKRQDPGSGFKILLFWMVIYLVIGPFLVKLPYAKVVLGLSLSSVLFFAIYALQRQAQEFSLAVIVMAGTLVLFWLGIFDIFFLPQEGYQVLLVIYFALLIFSYFKQILTAPRVTANMLAATLCLYLIIGLFWGGVYNLLESYVPGSFSGKLLDNLGGFSPIRGDIFNYFSFVTLTTLGYGDISPQTIGAATLCQVEAILGQFFVMVVVARLVSLYGNETKG